MTRTEYKAAIGTFYKSMTVILVVLGAVLATYPFVWEIGGVKWVLILIGATFLICGFFFIFFARVTYIFHDEGLSIEGLVGAAMLAEEYLNEIVPYRSMTEIRETKDMSYGATFTSDAMRIYYIKKNKRKDSFVIGPVDKDEFMEELEKRTGLKVKRFEIRSGK